MAVRGKPPKPAEEKKLRGGRKDRKPKATAKSETSRPECPVWLCSIGRGEWDAMTGELQARGILTAQDGRLLAIYCDAFARWRIARDDLDRNGPVLIAESGAVKANPAAAIADRLSRLMRELLAEWGMTPLGRLRSQPAGDDVKDDLGDFLAGGKP